MIFDRWMEQGTDKWRRRLGWAIVATLLVSAFLLARDESFVAAGIILIFNFELIKISRIERSFAEYLNAIVLHVFFYFYIGFSYLNRGKFHIELLFLVELAFVAFINIRYRFLSLTALVRFLALGTAISFPFTVWKHAYVPRMAARDSYIPLEFYRYWMTPIEMLLIAAPFLFVAFREDLKAVAQSAARSAMLDVYYVFSLPLLAFGLYPGIGHSHQANCALTSTYIAIACTVALICSGFLLSLITNRKSALVASALASLPLGVNLCVKVPLTEFVLVTALIALTAWRWLPKARARLH